MNLKRCDVSPDARAGLLFSFNREDILLAPDLPVSSRVQRNDGDAILQGPPFRQAAAVLKQGLRLAEVLDQHKHEHAH